MTDTNLCSERSVTHALNSELSRISDTSAGFALLSALPYAKPVQSIKRKQLVQNCILITV